MKEQFEDIAVSLDDDGVFTIRLARVRKKNALSPAMNREILKAVRYAADSPDVKALIFTGSEDSFCAGLDLELSFLETIGSDDPQKFREAMQPILAWYRELHEMEKPTVAAVNGHAYGGGIVPVSLCDISLASDKALFGLSEINFAHFPAGGSTWAVSHFLLPKHFEYLCLTGDRIDASEAMRMGLVTKVIPAAELSGAALEMARKLAGKHPNAYAVAKRMCRMTRQMPLWDAIALEMAHIHENYFFTQGEMAKVAIRQFTSKLIKTGAGESYDPALRPGR